MSLLAAYLLRDETNALTSLENRIHIQLIGGESPSRMKVRHELPAHKGYHGKQGW